MKTDIVVVSGKQGSGKSTFVREYTNQWEAEEAGELVVEIRFANTIYAIHDYVRDMMRKLGVARPDKDGKLLQLLGTEWGRNTIGENVWVDCARAAMSALAEDLENVGFKRVTFLVSDCRFKNEFDAFPDALKIRLECDPETRKERAEGWRDNDQHPSEIDLDDYVKQGMFDLTYNTKTDSPFRIALSVRAQLNSRALL